MKKNKGLKIVAIPVFVILGVTVFSYVVMRLWNFALVPATGMNEIDFWQAMGLLVLSKILFGFGGGGPKGRRGKWSKRGGDLTPDQRQALKHKWKERCEPDASEKIEEG